MLQLVRTESLVKTRLNNTKNSIFFNLKDNLRCKIRITPVVDLDSIVRGGGE